jgi:hypothetical protein
MSGACSRSDLRSCLDLGVEVRDRELREALEQRPQHLRRTHHHALQHREAARALSLDEVRGEGEGSAREAEERDRLRVELAPQRPQDVEHEPHGVAGVGYAQPLDVVRRTDGLGDDGTRAELHVDPGPEERHEDVGEHDHGLGAQEPQRLQGDLHRPVHVAAQLEKRDLLAHRAVGGQVAPGLSHEPDRRAIDRLATTRPEHPLRPAEPHSLVAPSSRRGEPSDPGARQRPRR